MPMLQSPHPSAVRPFPPARCRVTRGDRLDSFLVPLNAGARGNSLSNPGWQINQRLKPDIGYGWTSALGFYKGDGSSTSTRYSIPNDRFQIFAYCSEGRSLALGSTLTSGVFSGGDANLKAQLGYSTEHIWHSAQFRSSLAKRYQYWIALLDAASITHLNP